MKKYSVFLKPFLIALLTSLVIVLGVSWYANKKPSIGGDFTLNHRGQKWIFSEHSSKLNLLYIGYVKCPDICPMSLSYSGQAFLKLSDEEKKEVQLIFLSVDQAHDKAEDVANFASQFFDSFIGLTGTKSEIDSTVDLFHASYLLEKDPKSYLGYSISHTDKLFFLDKRGSVIDTIPNPRSSSLILKKIKEYL